MHRRGVLTAPSHSHGGVHSHPLAFLSHASQQCDGVQIWVRYAKKKNAHDHDGALNSHALACLSHGSQHYSCYAEHGGTSASSARYAPSVVAIARCEGVDAPLPTPSPPPCTLWPAEPPGTQPPHGRATCHDGATPQPTGECSLGQIRNSGMVLC